jgi:hypothetical protein
VGETQTLFGHAVDMGSGDDILPVTSEFGIAEIVRHDPDQVRAPLGGQ